MKRGFGFRPFVFGKLKSTGTGYGYMDNAQYQENRPMEPGF